MQDYRKTIISQYSSAATLTQLIENINDYLDPSATIDQFYTVVRNLDTAQSHGLDIWGRIVGVSRELTIPDAGYYFGYQTGTDDFAPFGDAPFSGGIPITSNFTLSDDAYRTLILIKAATNIARTVAPVMNDLLRKLFDGRGRAYVVSLGNMRMRYVFEFYLEPFELAVMTQSGVLPRPTGVGIDLIQVPAGSTFGFNEAGDAVPFGEGSFLSSGAIIDAN